MFWSNLQSGSRSCLAMCLHVSSNHHNLQLPVILVFADHCLGQTTALVIIIIVVCLLCWTLWIDHYFGCLFHQFSAQTFSPLNQGLVHGKYCVRLVSPLKLLVSGHSQGWFPCKGYHGTSLLCLVFLYFCRPSPPTFDGTTSWSYLLTISFITFLK